MNWRERLAGLDKRALLWSLLVAVSAFALLSLLVGRITRLASAQPLVASQPWEAPVGRELTLKGLGQDTLLSFESPEGGGLALEAGPVMFADGSRARRLDLFIQGSVPGAENDNKVGMRVAVGAGSESGVALRRPSRDRTPQFAIRNLGAPLRVETWVGIGERLAMPSIRMFRDGAEIEASELSHAFTLLPEGSLSIVLSAGDGGEWTSISLPVGTWGDAGPRLKMREASLANENEPRPWRHACGGRSGSYALGAFFRFLSSPVPTGADCAPDRLAATALTLQPDRISMDLSGSAFVFENGMPSASFWSEVMANPLLALTVNTALPLALTTLAGWVTFQKTNRSRPARGGRRAGRRKPRTRSPAAALKG